MEYTIKVISPVVPRPFTYIGTSTWVNAIHFPTILTTTLSRACGQTLWRWLNGRNILDLEAIKLQSIQHSSSITLLWLLPWRSSRLWSNSLLHFITLLQDTNSVAMRFRLLRETWAKVNVYYGNEAVWRWSTLLRMIDHCAGYYIRTRISINFMLAKKELWLL